MLLKPETIKEDWFKDAFALHFCSVSIGDFPMKDAHEKRLNMLQTVEQLLVLILT